MSEKRADKLERRKRRQGKRRRLRTIVVEKTATFIVEDGRLVEARFGVDVKEGSERSLPRLSNRP